MSKRCLKCKLSLPTENFGKNRQSKDGLDYYCRPCASQKQREQHLVRMQSPEYREKHNGRSRERAREKKRKAVEMFGGACFDCNETYPPYVLDFHHEGDKDGNPSHFIGRRTLASALTELDKCVLLCANCHRRRHYEKDINDDTTRGR